MNFFISVLIVGILKNEIMGREEVVEKLKRPVVMYE